MDDIPRHRGLLTLISYQEHRLAFFASDRVSSKIFSAKRVCVDGIAVGRRLTRGSDPSSFDDGLGCSRCHNSIPFLAECARLSPCSCILCLKCLAALHGQRGSQPLRCCDMKVSGHKIIGAERIPTDETVCYARCGKSISDEELEREQPFDFLLRKEFNRFDNSAGDGMIGVLYCRMIERVNGQLTVIHKSTHLHRLYNDALPPDYSSSIVRFFSFLHPHIIQPSVTPYSDIVKMTPHEFCMHAVKNYSPLLAALHGLATGVPFPVFDKITGKDYPDFQSVFLSIAAARDLILRCTNRYPQHLQLMIGDHLEMQSCSAVFKDVLSAFRLCYSRDYSDRAQCEAVVKKLEKGIDVGSNDLCLLNGDNIGFTILGIKALYAQYILFQAIVVREERLRELKILSDDPEEQLSREPSHDWLRLVEEDDGLLAKQLVTPSTADYEALTHCVCEGIRFAIDSEDRGAFRVGDYILRPGKIINQATRDKLERDDARNQEMDYATDSTVR